MSELYLGVLALMLPPVIVGAIVFRRNMRIFWFLVALVAVGTGYLVTTGAAQDIGRALMGTKAVRVAPAK